MGGHEFEISLFGLFHLELAVFIEIFVLELRQVDGLGRFGRVFGAGIQGGECEDGSQRSRQAQG